MSTNIVHELNDVSIQLTRYVSLALIFFGIIGNILNCIIFSQRKFRSNPCARYFLIASIAHSIAIVFGLAPRMVTAWDITSNLTETNPLLCKLRLFILFTTRNTASWLLVCATVDRYLVSSINIHLRRRSNIKQANRLIIIVFILSSLMTSETLYCFDANLENLPLKCYAKSNLCRIFNDLYQALVTTIIPSLIMLIFGLSTITNIHQSYLINSVMIRKNNISMRRRKTDVCLTRMLFLQILLLTIFTIPQALQKFYITKTFYQTKSLVQQTYETFLFSIVVLLTFIPNCLTFYLYTFTGPIFRRTLFQLIRNIIQRLKCTIRP